MSSIEKKATKTRVEAFARDLQVMRHEAGRPTYDELTHWSDLSRSTLLRAFSGNTLPTWRTTRAILVACDVDDEAIAAWQHSWSEVSKLVKGVDVNASRPADGPNSRGPEPTPVSSAEHGSCPECGAVIVDPLQHQQWHREWVRRPRRLLRAVSGPERS